MSEPRSLEELEDQAQQCVDWMPGNDTATLDSVAYSIQAQLLLCTRDIIASQEKQAKDIVAAIESAPIESPFCKHCGLKAGTRYKPQLPRELHCDRQGLHEFRT